MLEIERLPLLADNYAWLLFDPATGTSGVVDPAEAAPVLARLQALGRGLDWILSTHHHGDHVGGNLVLKSERRCGVVGPAREGARIPRLDQGVTEGELFNLGGRVARVIE